jgi:diguanylate cyclase (GGDEF)-like protein
MSITDALTGIYNRRFLEESMERIIKSLSRSGANLSVLMLDIDYFKNYNDTYGHNMGDACLKTLANTFVQSVVRANDFVARFGGEEFVIVLPNTNERGANTVAKRILNDVHERNIPHAKSDVASYVTVSIGSVTGKVIHTYTGADFIKKADQALYISKQNGRDRYTAVDMLTAHSALPFYHKN